MPDPSLPRAVNFRVQLSYNIAYPYPSCNSDNCPDAVPYPTSIRDICSYNIPNPQSQYRDNRTNLDAPTDQHAACSNTSCWYELSTNPLDT